MLTWTAPATRIYDFSGLFVSGNSPAQSAAVAITDSLGGTAPLSRTVLANDTGQSFSFSKAYTAGDVVQFQVGNNLTARPLTVAEGFQVVDLLQPVQHRHHCIISPLRLSADEWYHGVYQVLGIREEIDRDGVDVPLPSSSRQAG